MRRRHTWRGFFYHARCRDCDFEVTTKNALGVAAQHHDRTGHNVDIEIEGSVAYVNDAENERLLAQKKKA